ncbi:hypothetical protein TNCV_4841821 [Trichonephila clavipes]|uniref:Uncharacterized protein n=1 Tax=Trichonephila clavipes TaxID=2585209 RepID=A0A8X7BLP7_TRICX|nr:hypothetical protein TNCV_4841821 [Trichonephila clavipes]
MENAAGFFLQLGWKMNGDCKTKLAAGTVVEIEAGASLFTDPISDHQDEDPMGKPATPIAALTLQQCLSGDTEERYHQPIDRSGLTPTTHLQRSVGQRERKGIPRTPFSSLRDAAYGKHVGRKTNGVTERKVTGTPPTSIYDFKSTARGVTRTNGRIRIPSTSKQK